MEYLIMTSMTEQDGCNMKRMWLQQRSVHACPIVEDSGIIVGNSGGRLHETTYTLEGPSKASEFAPERGEAQTLQVHSLCT